MYFYASHIINNKVPPEINCSGVELEIFFFVAFDERIKKIIGAACRNA
jgi:hypothetical protein